ncbi:hypothetical protein MGWOODY_Mmi1435 [hydrothermal vent metagenome]|uniref:Uncharacterized protein n=1 Tax=hydrothermal vent metagenome TaxID=652676 RepID=A0A161JWA8_9ZZZZ
MFRQHSPLGSGLNSFILIKEKYYFLSFIYEKAEPVNHWVLDMVLFHFLQQR